MTESPEIPPEPDSNPLFDPLERERHRRQLQRGSASNRAFWMRLSLVVFLVLSAVLLWALALWLEREAKERKTPSRGSASAVDGKSQKNALRGSTAVSRLTGAVPFISAAAFLLD